MLAAGWLLLACTWLEGGLVRAQSLQPASGTESPELVEASTIPEPSSPPVEANPPDYILAINAAVQAHGRRDFLEARAYFERAHRIYPNARSLRGLGHVEFELGNYVKAVKYLSASLGSQVRPLDPPLAARVEKLLLDAKARVGAVRLMVSPATAVVSLDGSDVIDPSGTVLYLAPGDHVFEFRAQQRLSERRELRVEGGEEIVIQVMLSSLSPSLVHTPNPASPVQHDMSKRKKRWIWATAVAAVVVGAAVTAIVISTRDDQEHVRAPERSPYSLPGVSLEALRASH
ncbi:MAG: tetratricopeptide repeat protein [Myxococcales bacterium]